MESDASDLKRSCASEARLAKRWCTIDGMVSLPWSHYQLVLFLLNFEVQFFMAI